MTEAVNRTLVCSVLFIDIVGYSKKGVAEQVKVKRLFNEILTSALEQVAPRERVVVDTGDGAAITFLGDPEGALFVSLAVLDKVGELPLRLGINLGPVSLIKDINFLDFEEGFPALLGLILMPLTFSITVGIGAAFVAYVFIKVVVGKWRDVHPLMWLVAIAFAVYFGQAALQSLLPTV